MIGTANPYAGDPDRETIIFGEGASQTIEMVHRIKFNYFENCEFERARLLELDRRREGIASFSFAKYYVSTE